MSEYLVKRQSLENIADEIRVLSGTTEPLGLAEMATNVNDANDEVADQTDLIAQVVSALQGKSVPGGGEDVTEETATYTDLLTDLEAAVDALPDAGSGGSGGGVETCTVKLIIRSGWNQYGFTVYKNGVIDVETVTAPYSAGTTIVVENVVCGSIFDVYPSGGSVKASITGGATLVGYYQYMLFKATMTANETTEVTIYSNI